MSGHAAGRGFAGRGFAGRGFAGAAARKALWRVVLTVTGGLRVRGAGRLPGGPCVIVSNHNSHADTAALIAALPARRRPAVAAAADYWFDGSQGWSGRLRPWACRALCGAFPVRRGGGSADLADAARLLADGRDVIVYPEGSRSRDGQVGEFRRGAARLAAVAGVPLVPVGMTGTRAVLPASRAASRPRRSVVTVRIGLPVLPGAAIESVVVSSGVAAATVAADVVASVTAQARAQVTQLVALPTGPTRPAGANGPAGAGPAGAAVDSALRAGVARFAASWRGGLLVAAWAFAEALSWPLLPELILAVVCVAAPKAGARLAFSAAVGSVAGGVAGYLLAARGIVLPEPVTTARMHAAVAAQVAAHGAAAVLAQPLSGIPFKVYVAASGAHHAGLARFAVLSAQARGARILAFGLTMTVIGACARRWRRFYLAYLVAVAIIFLAGLPAVVAAWS